MDCEVGWVVGYKDVTASTNERTMTAAVLPTPCSNYSIRCLFVPFEFKPLLPCLLGNLNALVYDYIARQSLSGLHLAEYIVKQIPVLAPQQYTAPDVEFILPRVTELTYTGWDLAGFANEVHHAHPNHLSSLLRCEVSDIASRPQWASTAQFCAFSWNEERRSQRRAELDAYYAHLYGLTRDELRYILDPKDVFGEDFPSETFRVLKEREIKEYGEYRTQRLVLEAFDKLADSPRFRDEMPKRVSAFEVPQQPMQAATV